MITEANKKITAKISTTFTPSIHAEMKIIQYKYIYIEINNLHIFKQAVIYDSNKELLVLGLHCQHVFKFTSLNNSNEFEFEFLFWCLTPLSAISQLYHGDQF